MRIFFEVRLALRSLVQRWRVSLFLILMFVFGISLAGGSFLVFRELVLDPLPFPDSDQLHLVSQSSLLGKSGLTIAQIDAISETDVLVGAGGYRSESVTMISPTAPVRITATRATPSLLKTLGVKAVIGRVFTEKDSGCVLLNESFWKTAFGSDLSILGKVLTLDGGNYQIIGVLPSEAVLDDQPAQVWMPFSNESGGSGGLQFLQTIGRLKQGVPRAEAERLLAVPLGATGGGGRTLTLSPLAGVVTGDSGEIVSLLLVGSLSILAGTCIAVTLFLLVHLTSGAQFHALIMRRILGGTAGNLAARLLGLIGGVVAPASLLAFGSLFLLRLFLVQWKGDLAQFQDVRMDAWVALSIGCLGIAAAAACFLPVFLYVSRADIEAAVSRAGRFAAPQSGQLHRMFLSTVVAMTLALGLGAAVAFSSIAQLSGKQLGFDPRNCFVAVVAPSEDGSLSSERHFWKELLRRLEKERAVAEIGAASSIPSYGGRQAFLKKMESGDEVLFAMNSVSPGFFPALGIPLIRGREFTEDDHASNPPVAILNLTAAKILFGSADAALGKTVGFPHPVTVVGVSHDHLSRIAQQEAKPVVWLPYQQHSSVATALVLRGDQIEMPMLQRWVREAVDSLDAARPVEIFSLESLLGAPLRRPRLAVSLMSLFAVILLLFFLGVISGNVVTVLKRQSKQIAIRVATVRRFRTLSRDSSDG